MKTLEDELVSQLREEPKKLSMSCVNMIVAGIAGIVAGSIATYFLLEPKDAWEENVRQGAAEIYASDGAYSVHRAAREGNVRMLMRWCLNGEEVNRRDVNGDTPLHVAVTNSQPDSVMALLIAGADTTIKNKGGKTAMELVAEPAVRFAFDYAKKIREEELSVYKELRRGNGQALLRALKRGVNPNAPYAPNTDQNFLAVACEKCTPQVIQQLMKSGIDVREQVGRTPLLRMAIAHDRGDLIPILINGGCNPYWRNKNNGAFLLHNAVYDSKNKAFAALLPYYECMNYAPRSDVLGTPMSLAVEKGNMGIYQMLRSVGADPRNPVQTGGGPLLITAVNSNQEAMVRQLLKDGVDKNARNKQGKSALDYAKGKIAELLNE